MQRLFSWGQRNKPEVSVTKYGLALEAGLQALRNRPFVRVYPWLSLSVGVPPATPDRDQEEAAEVLPAFSQYWEKVNAARLDLEEARPEPRLAGVHMEAVKLMRATLEMMNAWGKVTIAIAEGNFVAAQQRYSGLKDSERLAERVQSKLQDQLTAVLEQQTDLFVMLGLSRESLTFLDIDPDHPYLVARR